MHVLQKSWTRRMRRINSRLKLLKILLHKTAINRDARSLLNSHLIAIARMSTITLALTRLTQTVRAEGLRHENVRVRILKLERVIRLMRGIRPPDTIADRLRVLLLILTHKRLRHAVLRSINDRRHKMHRRADVRVIKLLAHLLLRHNSTLRLAWMNIRVGM